MSKETLTAASYLATAAASSTQSTALRAHKQAIDKAGVRHRMAQKFGEYSHFEPEARETLAGGAARNERNHRTERNDTRAPEAAREVLELLAHPSGRTALMRPPVVPLRCTTG